MILLISIPIIGKGDTPVSICESNKLYSILRELLLIRPEVNLQLLREENWKARKVALLISVPRPSTLISTIDMESNASPKTNRNSRIVISVDGTIEIQEGSLDNLRLARKSLKRSLSGASQSPNPQNNTNNNGNTSSPSTYLNLQSEYEIEHRSFVEIQDLYISLYLVNHDLWRYVILYL